MRDAGLFGGAGWRRGKRIDSCHVPRGSGRPGASSPAPLPAKAAAPASDSNVPRRAAAALRSSGRHNGRPAARLPALTAPPCAPGSARCRRARPSRRICATRTAKARTEVKQVKYANRGFSTCKANAQTRQSGLLLRHSPGQFDPLEFRSIVACDKLDWSWYRFSSSRLPLDSVGRLRRPRPSSQSRQQEEPGLDRICEQTPQAHSSFPANPRSAPRPRCGSTHLGAERRASAAQPAPARAARAPKGRIRPSAAVPSSGSHGAGRVARDSAGAHRDRRGRGHAGGGRPRARRRRARLDSSRLPLDMQQRAARSPRRSRGFGEGVVQMFACGGPVRKHHPTPPTMPPPPRRQTRFHKVIVMQPMVAFKNALQEGRPLPRTPIALYRGLVVGVATRHY